MLAKTTHHEIVSWNQVFLLQINKEWNRLALEYLKEKRVIECVQVRPGDDSDKEVKIALTISKQDTGYFDVNHWNGSESDEDFLGKSVSGLQWGCIFDSYGWRCHSIIVQVVAVSSSYNIQNIFLDHFGGSKILALTFCICFSWFAIPVGVVAYSYFIVITLLNLLIVKLAGRFHSLRNTAIRFTRYNCINDRARIKRRQTNPGTKAKRQRYQLIKLLELSARIKTLKVHDVDMLAFDAFCHCLGTVQIGRLEISLKNYGILNLNFGMHWQIFEWVFLFSKWFLKIIFWQRGDQTTRKNPWTEQRSNDKRKWNYYVNYPFCNLSLHIISCICLLCAHFWKRSKTLIQQGKNWNDSNKWSDICTFFGVFLTVMQYNYLMKNECSSTLLRLGRWSLSSFVSCVIRSS